MPAVIRDVDFTPDEFTPPGKKTVGRSILCSLCCLLMTVFGRLLQDRGEHQNTLLISKQEYKKTEFRDLKPEGRLSVNKQTLK